MMLQRRSRWAGSVILALSVALWAQAAAASSSSDDTASECQSHAMHMQRAMHGSQVEAEGCCPMHAAVLADCSLHLVMLLAPVAPPDCCALSGAPAPATEFLTSSSAPEQPQDSASEIRRAAPLSLERATFSEAATPRFTKPVFDLKTDLRI